MVVLCLAAFMAMLDVFVVNVAFTGIGASFAGSSLADLSWVLNAYTIVYAALLIPAGRLADRHGRKAGPRRADRLHPRQRGCAVAPGLWWLVAFRVLQAAGAAALTPVGLGLLLTALAPERRAGAVKVWATTSSFAAALGPVVGGALVELSWNWVFLINVPVGVVAFATAMRLVPESRDESVTRLPDVPGAVVLAGRDRRARARAGEGWRMGLDRRGGPGCVRLAVAGIALLVVRVLRHPAPVVEPALFRVPAFVWANATALVFCTAFGALFPSVVLWLENVAGHSAIATGVAILPGPLMVPLFAMVGQRLARRMPAGALVAVGNLVFCLGAVMLAWNASAQARFATDVLPGWIVTGVGIGLALPTLMAVATAGLPPAQAATGSAVVNTGRQLGYVLGVAVLVAGSTPRTPERRRVSRARGGSSPVRPVSVPSPRSASHPGGGWFIVTETNKGGGCTTSTRTSPSR
ncbi:MFS transporter [Amycolatopsis thermoflava]|uniref:Putative MFS family arabinose efflux permease n=1 Tax=Amycolatopsis thermoflava TaxID=84480 RepID=A0A3N2H7V4_9PSEU|nr:MFS transporter [Amycolatopsis thermoflava]ROS44967.1 putative MFS family arabinose efflux permease [Amycolatopsis thermoflava]